MTTQPEVAVKHRIRSFRIKEYKNLINLWKTAGLTYCPRGRDSFRQISQQSRSSYIRILVAEAEGRIIGAVLGTHDRRRGWINRLAVHPEYQRKGVARQLVMTIERWLSEQGIKIVCALIEDENKKSVEFMQNAGYVRHNHIIYFSKRKSNEV